ncbi:MAG: NAD(P)-dependent alcohol dehydrogenase [Bacteroidetes bacterium]|nr:NAD(P)-dependent alcohol dehydrogenase [Bacteroidota bacterium]
MTAVICTAYGKPEVLKLAQVSRPAVKTGEILVKIIATAVNSGDVRVRAMDANWWQRVLMRLIIGINKPRKPVLGTVYAGVVMATGEGVTEFAVGDEVYGLTGFGFGTYAEYISVKAKGTVLHKPVNASFEEAAAILFGGQTAVYFLQQAGIEKRAGQKVMIYGASGAVGVAAVQIAGYYNAEVTAVCSTANAALLQSIGAGKVVCYDKTNISHGAGRFDLVFDAVGKLPAEQGKKLLRAGGLFKSVAGGDYARESRAQLELLRKLFEGGHLKAVIDKTYPLSEAVQAHVYVDAGHKKGNVVLKVA